MKRGDVWIVIVLVVVMLAFMLPRWLSNAANVDQYDGKVYARITVEGKEFQTIELTEEARNIEVKTDRGYNLFKIHDYGIEVITADCRDLICQTTYGFIHKVGQTIVCLPNRVFVEIVGAPSEGDEIDAIAN